MWDYTSCNPESSPLSLSPVIRFVPSSSYTSHRLPHREWGDYDGLNNVNDIVYFKYMEAARIQYFSKMLDCLDSLALLY